MTNPSTASEDARLATPLLHEVFGGATRRLRARLASRTGLDSPVRVASVTLSTLEALCIDAAYSDVALWCSFPIGSTAAYTLVEGRLLTWLMGRLFGEGEVSAPSPRPGGLTEVECVIGARMCRELIDAVAECWAGPDPLVIRAGPVARSRRLCAEIDPTTPYAITVLDFGAEAGRLFVALPANVLETLAPRRPTAPAAPVRKAPRFDRVMPVQVELVVELARLSLPLARLQGLRVGEELPLGALSEAIGTVGDRKAFYGEPGTSGGLRSFRIVRRADSPSSPGGGDR